MNPEDELTRIIEAAETAFLDSLKGIDQQLAKEIIKIYAKFVIAGDLALDALLLANLEETLIAAISKTDYSLALNSYLPNFDVIQQLNKAIHKEVNNIDITAVINENVKIANFQSVVTSQLKGTPSTVIKVEDVIDGERVIRTLPIRNSSLNELLDPIAQIIRKDVITGVSFESATESILNAIQRKKLGLDQWASQIAIDALSQADGITQDEVRKEFDLKYIRYIGNVIKTTRPLCFHLIRSKKKPVYKFTELQTILNNYVPDGTPSKSSTTETADGKEQEKGSGIIPGTDEGNFLIRRGGYRCRHRAIPTRL